MMATINLYSKEQTDALLAGKANSADIYTKTETNTLLGTKANSADVYTKTETDTLLGTKANSADVYTKGQTDTLLAGKQNKMVITSITNHDQYKNMIANMKIGDRVIVAGIGAGNNDDAFQWGEIVCSALPGLGTSNPANGWYVEPNNANWHPTILAEFQNDSITVVYQSGTAFTNRVITIDANSRFALSWQHYE